jgi:hypothetical protein
MKVSEAPRSGWYPDPVHRVSLRWWDGTDWTDRSRARPDAAEMAATEMGATEPTDGAPSLAAWDQFAGSAGHVPQQTAAIVEQVRMAARAEAERAADDFSRRAREITGAIPPLVSQYTNKFMRFFRLAVMLTILVAIVWFVYQVWAQKQVFDWIGDRIDELTDENAVLSQ